VLIRPQTFQGITYGDGRRVVLYGGQALPPRRDLVDYGATEFDWGYSGPAVAQLAVAMLAAVLGDDVAAVALHQEYAERMLTAVQVAQWNIPALELVDWCYVKPDRAAWLGRN
jgi:hypothetical protein